MHTFTQPSKGLAQIKVPLYLVLIAALIPTLYIYFNTFPSRDPEISAAPVIVDTGVRQQAMYRLNGTYKFTKPLLLTELPSEDESMSGLKQSLNGMIADMKGRGDVTEASVFIRKLNTGAWTSINPSVKYSPGSMLKIAVLITYLKMQEADPGLFDKQLTLRADLIPAKKQYVDESHIQPGQYKIRYLIERMIVNSDNYATLLLNKNINNNTFGNLFENIGLARLDINEAVYTMSPREYSRILLLLYNSTYLSPSNSEYALDLLTRSEYKDGILAGINDNNLKVSHKFGESGNGTYFELHESGIVYLDNAPYILVIMSRGSDIKLLPAVLKNTSAVVHQYMKANS